jgi:hypothetical protein
VRALAPGDGFAVPLFGEAAPAAQAMFGAEVGMVCAPPITVVACAACGSAVCTGCGAVAVALDGLEASGPKGLDDFGNEEAWRIAQHYGLDGSPMTLTRGPRSNSSGPTSTLAWLVGRWGEPTPGRNRVSGTVAR